VTVEEGTCLIRARGVSKHFQLGAQVVRALREVDAEVYQGEFLLIMGPSGSGKSTLLNLIGGLDRPTAGHIEVEGRDIAGLDELALAGYRRRSIGFVFQSFNLISTMSARQNVEFPMIFAGLTPRERHARAELLLQRVGLGERIGHRPLELSGGEQQRVAIARAMANNPTIVLGDEPTGNLDTKTGEEILDLLTVLNDEGTTLLLVTHDPRLVSYAHRVIHMQDGRVLRVERGGRPIEIEPTPEAET
jgi:putative ABC transport system ATP-binding protein